VPSHRLFDFILFDLVGCHNLIDIFVVSWAQPVRLGTSQVKTKERAKRRRV